MAANRRAAPKKIAPAEKKRRAMATKKHKPAPKSPLAKKKISNAEALKLMKKQSKAKALKRTIKKHMIGNKPSRQRNAA
jgi:hypothetical protein